MKDKRLQSAADYAAEKLRLSIIDGGLKPGTRIHQHALANELGVSHVPLREAVQKLEGEGFVSIHPRRGAFVVPLSRDDVREIYDLRLDLETKILSLSIPNLTSADMKIIQERCHDADTKAETVSYGELNKKFHLALYAGAKRPRLLSMIEGLWDNAARYSMLLRHVTPTYQKYHLDHWDLAEATMQKDSDKACIILAKHIHSAALEIDAILKDKDIE